MLRILHKLNLRYTNPPYTLEKTYTEKQEFKFSKSHLGKNRHILSKNKLTDKILLSNK